MKGIRTLLKSHILKKLWNFAIFFTLLHINLLGIEIQLDYFITTPGIWEALPPCGTPVLG